MRYIRAISALILSAAIFVSQVSAAGKYINMQLTYDGAKHSYSAEEVILKVEGRELTNLPMPPIIFNSYTLVPAREVFEALGAQVNWISDLYQVYIKYNDDLVMLEIDSKKAYVNGEAVEMALAPKIINDKTMIPLRFVSESIGMEVGWDSQSRVASVSKPVPTTTTTTTTETTTETTTSAVKITKFGSSSKMNEYTSKEYDTVNITSLAKASDSDSMFLVGASGAISSAEINKISSSQIAVDISSAKSSLSSHTYEVEDGRVNNIEISQQSGLKPAVRLLFNMDKDSDFSLYLSSDRKTLGISTGTCRITDITLDKLIGGDRLTITGTEAPSVKTITSATGDLLTVDVMNAILDIDNGTLKEGRVVNGGSYHQYNANTVRISLDLKDRAGFTTDVKGNSIALTIATGMEANTSASAGGGVRFDEGLGLIIPGAAGIVSPSSAIHSDNYNDLNYVITLNGSLGSVLSSQTIEVNNGQINNIDIDVESYQTTVKLNESRIMAVNVTSSGSDLYIKPVLPKEKYDKIVVLDAGHGGYEPGTIYGSLQEKDITLSILNKARALFDSSDIKCYATRTTDVYPTFDERTALADEGDMFISIHINSAPNTSAGGTETFCQYPNNLGNGLTSYTVAERVLNKLLENLGTTNRKVKSNDLRVLRESHVPCTLAEIGFITNDADRAMMTSEDGQNKAALAIYQAVTELFDEYPSVR